MQPDVFKIQQHLNNIGDLIDPARTLQKRAESNPARWATVYLPRPSLDEQGSFVLEGSYGSNADATAHEEMEIQLLNQRAIQEAEAIRKELRKCPLLDIHEMDIDITYYPPIRAGYRASISFDNVGFGTKMHLVRDLCDDIRSYLNALAKVPPQAMEGPMRAFSVNEGFASHYAPSPEALIFKLNITGQRIRNIMEVVDYDQAQRRLAAMTESQAA